MKKFLGQGSNLNYSNNQSHRSDNARPLTKWTREFPVYFKFWHLKNYPGAPNVAQQEQWCLGRAGTQVQSPAQHSGLRIWYCRSCGFGHDCGLDLIPGPRVPYATGQPKMKKKKKITQIVFLHPSAKKKKIKLENNVNETIILSRKIIFCSIKYRHIIQKNYMPQDFHFSFFFTSKS